MALGITQTEAIERALLHVEAQFSDTQADSKSGRADVYESDLDPEEAEQLQRERQERKAARADRKAARVRAVQDQLAAKAGATMDRMAGTQDLPIPPPSQPYIQEKAEILEQPLKRGIRAVGIDETGKQRLVDMDKSELEQPTEKIGNKRRRPLHIG